MSNNGLLACGGSPAASTLDVGHVRARPVPV
jgi:hypothetical protein